MPQWTSIKLNVNGRELFNTTDAPNAVADPFVSEYDNQLHVAYLDQNGKVSDVWLDPNSLQWSAQTVDKDSNPKFPVSFGPSIGTFLNQQHFCYLRQTPGPPPEGGTGIPMIGLFDSFYDSARGWIPQQ